MTKESSVRVWLSHPHEKLFLLLYNDHLRETYKRKVIPTRLFDSKGNIIDNNHKVSWTEESMSGEEQQWAAIGVSVVTKELGLS